MGRVFKYKGQTKLLNRGFFCLEVRWVRGHDGNNYNEMCDQLAKEGRHNKIVNNNYE